MVINMEAFIKDKLNHKTFNRGTCINYALVEEVLLSLYALYINENLSIDERDDLAYLEVRKLNLAERMYLLSYMEGEL